MRRTIIALIVYSLIGCTSVVQREDGTWDVPRQVEVRSAFGTNQSAMSIDNCMTEERRLFAASLYTGCTEVVPYTFASSPGQFGMVAAGALMGAGLTLSGPLGGK